MHAFIGRKAFFHPAADDTFGTRDPLNATITGVEERGDVILVDLDFGGGEIRNGVLFADPDGSTGAFATPGFADKVESAIVDGLGGLLGSIEKAIDGVESKVGTLIGHADGAVIGVDHDTTIASVNDETVAGDPNTQAAVDVPAADAAAKAAE